MTLKADRLSTRLRTSTRADHEAAQGSGFLDALSAGRLPVAAYADLAAQHWFIYRTLEQAGADLAADPVAGPFVDPALVRLPALGADLEHLLGPAWRERIVALPATSAYVERLTRVDPYGFVAHHYTRYLGDLSGGQYLGPAIAEAYHLNGAGHAFFVFGGIDPPAFRTHYRELLDTTRWPAPDEQRFLAEVSTAYQLNIDVLSQLKERWT